MTKGSTPHATTPRRIPEVEPLPPVTPRERATRGLAARDRAPLERHGHWRRDAGRPDPVAILERQASRRDPRPGADPAPPDGCLAVRVLPRRGSDHGERPLRLHGDRPARAALGVPGNEADHATLDDAIARGRLPATDEQIGRVRRDDSGSPVGHAASGRARPASADVGRTSGENDRRPRRSARPSSGPADPQIRSARP